MNLNIDTLLPPEEQESEEDKKLAVGFAESFVKAVYEDLDDIKKSFFRIGFRLTEANENNYFKVLGYATIIDLAEDKFGFGKTTTYGLMQVYEFARDWKQPMQMDSRYEKYSQSQLLEMSKRGIWAKDDFLKRVTPQDNVTDIKKAITIWNKYTEKHSVCPGECKTVKDILKLEKPKEEPQQDLLQLAKSTEPEVAVPTSEEGFSGYLENSEENSEEQEKITDDEIIKKCLQVGTGFQNGKLRVYEACFGIPDRAEFIKELKFLYGTGSCTAHDAKYYKRCESYSRGLIITRKDGSEMALPWTFIAGRIRRLIEAGEYLTAEEKERYQNQPSEERNETERIREVARSAGLPFYEGSDEEFEEFQKSGGYVYDGNMSVEDYEQMLRDMEADNGNTPESDESNLQSAEDNFSGYPENTEEPPAVQKLNLKNEQARREWLDNFRSWGEWLSVPEVNKTFYRYNFVNGCALIVEIGAEYIDCYDGKGRSKETEWKSYSIIDEKHEKYDSRGISYTLVIQWLTEHGKEI